MMKLLIRKLKKLNLIHEIQTNLKEYYINKIK